MVSLSNHGSSRLELPTTTLHDSDVVLSLAKHDRKAIPSHEAPPRNEAR
jgi:hypothetical protein